MTREQDQELSHNGSDKRRRPSSIPKWIGVGLFIYASVFVLGAAKNFLVPVVLAFLLAMVFAPIRRFLDRRGFPSGLSSLVIVLALFIVFISIAASLAVPVSNWVAKAPRIEAQVQQKLSTVSRSLHGLFEANQKIQSLTHTAPTHVQKVKVEGPGLATSAAMLAPGVMAQFIFTFVLLLFLLASGDMFYEKLVHVMPTFRDKRQAVRIAYNIERKLSRYLLTIAIINAGLGLAVGIAMELLGMPSPLIFGVIAFLFNFIPYLGAISGIVIATVVALVSFDWVGWGPIVGAVYFSLTAIEGQFITPYFVGRNLRLNTVVVFLAVSFWAWRWSAVGMIVAVPLLVAVKTFCEHIDGLNSLGDFLSERYAELEPPSEAEQ